MKTQQETIFPYQEQMDTLVDMRLLGKLTEEEYKTTRTKLLKQIDILKERTKKPKDYAQSWQSVAEMAFDFSAHAHEIFQKADNETKRTLLRALGSNFTLYDRKLNYELNPLLRPIKITGNLNNYAEYKNR